MRSTLGAAAANTAAPRTKTRDLLIIALLFGGSASAQPGMFAATGNMITPRFAHIATLLPNGKVLIAGGNTICFIGVAVPCGSPNGAELYDPATGTFTATTGSMATVQPSGGALLPDGRVLFAGSDITGAQAVVELYDASTDLFKVAGHATMLTAVSLATLLNDGRVLLIGRVGNSLPQVYAAELYDPASGTFSPASGWTGQEPVAATTLVDGRILFQNYEDYAQLYDPAAGTFTSTGGLRGFDGPPQSTLLLNGGVLFTGGNDIGGSESSAELYDPATGTFANTRMSTARDGHTSTLLSDGTVLVAAGSPIASAQYHPTATAEIYDPTTEGFYATANMTTARSDHTATLLNSGQVLLTGGTALGSLSFIIAISSAELYTPAVSISAPVLFSLSGDGQGPGAIWHADTGQIASSGNPAVAGDALAMYTTNLVAGSLIPPQVIIGGRLADVLYFGDAPGYPGYSQVNFLMPNLVAPGPAVSARLSYLGRSSNEVTIGVH